MSESGTRFATSVTSVYTLMMRLRRRGLGSSRGERDSKTRISAALTRGSGCLLEPSLSAAEPAPLMSNARRGAEYLFSKARSSGTLLSCNTRAHYVCGCVAGVVQCLQHHTKCCARRDGEKGVHQHTSPCSFAPSGCASNSAFTTISGAWAITA